MNPFTAHTRNQGVTYVEHWCFAMGVAGRLLHPGAEDPLAVVRTRKVARASEVLAGARQTFAWLIDARSSVSVIRAVVTVAAGISTG